MISLNYSNCINGGAFSGGINQKDILKYKKREQELKNSVFENSTNKWLGWVELPNAKRSKIKEIADFAKQVNQKFENFVVLGIGGSALGSIAVQTALSVCKKPATNVYVCDNIDPDAFYTLLNSLDIKKTMFDVITKSGSTVETMTQMSIALDKVKNKYPTTFYKNFVITTEKDNLLFNYATANNIRVFEVPTDVGGRFSVLSPVGLLPIAVMGGNIFHLLAGANEMFENAKFSPLEQNLSLLSAVVNYELLLSGKDEVVVMPYSQGLSKFSDFYLQLIGESLGKNLQKNGKPNKYTLTPIRALGATDQHSQIQLFVEGKNNKTFLFIRQENFENTPNVPPHPIEKYDRAMPGTMQQLINTEQIATALALKQNNRPSMLLKVPNLNEENLGALLYYFEATTAFMGELLNIDTYNQPGVEQGKINAKALMGSPDFSNEKLQLIKLQKSENKYQI